MKKFWLSALLIAAGACSPQQGTFDDKFYQMLNAPKDAEITLGFQSEDHRYYGKSAVNRYFGIYKTDGSSLTFGPAGATMMMGPPFLMEAEHEYLKALAEVISYTVEGTKLTLKTSGGQELLFKERSPEIAQ